MKKEYKIVGISIEAPKEARYMAFDANGQLWFYGDDITFSLGSIEMFVLSARRSSIPPLIIPSFWLDVPEPCSNPDWWKGTKRKIDASGGVVNIYIEAPVWAEWMAFNSMGELCFYDIEPRLCFYFPTMVRWYYYGMEENCKLKIKVPKHAKDPDWWKKTLRRID